MQAPPARPYRLETIVEQGLCVGCGLCQAIAGASNVRMTLSGEGGERPVVVGRVSAPTLHLINEACPGIRCHGYRDGTRAQGGRIAPRIHPIWGPALWMGIGHAGDGDVRFRASSGGALSALALHLLSSGEVKFILHVAASKDKPARTVRQLSFDAAQVMEGAGSRYGPAAPLIDFKSVLDRGEPFAFIGKPCDISAIRNYAELDPRVDELLRYTLNFFCGGVSEFGKTLGYIRKAGMTEQDVSHLRYRGWGCPGPMAITSRSGEVHTFDYNEVWEDERRWQLQFRCKICPDSLGDLADVSVADVWPGGKPDTEGLGFNGFIARTARGLNLLEAAIASGAVKITEPLDWDGLELAQSAHRLKKQAMASRLAAMRDAGLIVPSFVDLRLQEASESSDPATRRANYEGMLDRLRRGDNCEPVPPSAP
jgi:coenzyme F420 hydrogenase subunit beta